MTKEVANRIPTESCLARLAPLVLIIEALVAGTQVACVCIFVQVNTRPCLSSIMLTFAAVCGGPQFRNCVVD